MVCYRQNNQKIQVIIRKTIQIFILQIRP